MDKIFAEMNEADRLQAIKDNAHFEEKNFDVKRFLTEDELTELRKEISDEAILIGAGTLADKI